MGPQTVVVDGSRFPVPGSAAYAPYGFGQLTQPQPLPNVNFPPMLPAGGASGSGGAMSESIGGYGTAGQNSMAAAQANANPFSLKASPTIWAMVLLIVAIVGLSMVHWRKTTLAGGDANLHVGPAEGGAEAGV